MCVHVNAASDSPSAFAACDDGASGGSAALMLTHPGVNIITGARCNASAMSRVADHLSFRFSVTLRAKRLCLSPFRWRALYSVPSCRHLCAFWRARVQSGPCPARPSFLICRSDSINITWWKCASSIRHTIPDVEQTLNFVLLCICCCFQALTPYLKACVRLPMPLRVLRTQGERSGLVMMHLSHNV